MTYTPPSLSEINNEAGKAGLNCISTFSGSGGSSLGYKMAGFNVLVASEFMPAAAATYRLNHPGTYVLPDDIRNVTGNVLLGIAGLKQGELDLLDGSPPCSAFSMAGLRDKAWGVEKDYSSTTQQVVDDLFFEFARLVDEIHPKVFVAENVSGLVAGSAKGYFKEIMQRLKGAGPGYNVVTRKIESMKLGVPQRRQRLIFIGVRSDIDREPAFPSPCSVRIPLKAAIEDLPRPNPANLDDFADSSLEEREYDILNEGTRTRMAWDNTDVLRDKGCFRHAYQRLFNKDARYMWFKLNPAEVCPTITAKIPSLFRWDEPRTLSVAEIKRLSSFPDDFVCTGNFRAQWERIGRAVPPMMMGLIASKIAQDIFDVKRETLADKFIRDLKDGA
jgi:DNA (cytosine-5)-methyltransferase 1